MLARTLFEHWAFPYSCPPAGRAGWSLLGVKVLPERIGLILPGEILATHAEASL